jgi:hypothetical protein
MSFGMAHPAPKPKRHKSINARWRSPNYLKWVRTQPCCFPHDDCSGPIQVHHSKGVGNLSGVGLKAPDWATMPLCAKHHNELHATPELWPEQWEMVVRTLGKAIDDGVLVVSRAASFNGCACQPSIPSPARKGYGDRTQESGASRQT